MDQGPPHSVQAEYTPEQKAAAWQRAFAAPCPFCDATPRQACRRRGDGQTAQLMHKQRWERPVQWLYRRLPSGAHPGLRQGPASAGWAYQPHSGRTAVTCPAPPDTARGDRYGQDRTGCSTPPPQRRPS
ncbi:MAG: zinc finger domain-containing protein [Jatrophihabitans sp.]